MDVDMYWDVDGVINSFLREGDRRWEWPDYTQAMVAPGEYSHEFVITYSPTLVEAINDLTSRDDVHPHWLTTWLRGAPERLSPVIGLKGQEWPVLGIDDYASVYRYTGWWKLPAAQRHAEATDHRIVWIDDDLNDRSAQQWARTLGDRILIAKPDPEVGVTPALFDTIVRWIDTGSVD